MRRCKLWSRDPLKETSSSWLTSLLWQGTISNHIISSLIYAPPELAVSIPVVFAQVAQRVTTSAKSALPTTNATLMGGKSSLVTRLWCLARTLTASSVLQAAPCVGNANRHQHSTGPKELTQRHA